MNLKSVTKFNIDSRSKKRSPARLAYYLCTSFGIYVHLVSACLLHTVRYVNHIISFFFSTHAYTDIRNCDIFVHAFHARSGANMLRYMCARSTLIRYLLPVPPPFTGDAQRRRKVVCTYLHINDCTNPT